MPRHDIVIHAPEACTYYDGAATLHGGGAERQTYLLARALAARGMRVAHVVYSVAEPIDAPGAPVTLIQQPRPESHGSAADLAAKSRAVWRGLERADAAVQLFRGADGTVGVGGAWTRTHKRKLVFAGANDSDFTYEGFEGRSDPRAAFFRAGMRVVDTVVVQSEDQARLARERFAHVPSLEQINSFVAPCDDAPPPGEAFLWVSRLVDYKRPLLYVDLAAALPEARFWMIPTETTGDHWEATRAELCRRAEGLPNLEILDQLPHAELQELVGRSVAMVNTSSFEGMPNMWLEGWARGIPALTLSFDPDGRIAGHGLGHAAGGDWDGFVAAARTLWEGREDRGGLSGAVQAYAREAHGTQVGDRWAALVERLASAS